MGERFEAYKGRGMGEVQVHDFVVRSLDARVITTQQIPRVLEQWRTPKHPEFAEQRNAWRLFNAYTEVLKEANVFALPRRTQTLHGLMDNECEILARAE